MIHHTLYRACNLFISVVDCVYTPKNIVHQCINTRYFKFILSGVSQTTLLSCKGTSCFYMGIFRIPCGDYKVHTCVVLVLLRLFMFFSSTTAKVYMVLHYERKVITARIYFLFLQWTSGLAHLRQQIVYFAGTNVAYSKSFILRVLTLRTANRLFCGY